MSFKSACVILCVLGMPFTSNAAENDCAPVERMATYVIDPNVSADSKAERRAFDEYDFPLANGQSRSVQGRLCRQRYFLKLGVTEPSPKVIVQNHTEQFARLGAKVLFADDCRATAQLKQTDKDVWMSVSCAQGFASDYTVTVVEVGALKGSLAAPDSKDYRLLGHLPGYAVVSTDSTAELTFPLAEGTGNGVKLVTVTGKQQSRIYQPTDSVKAVSNLEILTNYANAIVAAKGQIVFQGKEDITARMDDNGTLVWLRITALFGEVRLNVMEETEIRTDTVSPKVDALKTALDKNGRIALYVNFDFNKARLRPDAAPVLEQVVALLKANPAYKLTIEGHTDNVGGADLNQKLSDARAASVVDAVVKGGIDRTRLSSAGRGLSSPVSTNDTSEGRAKNRRVELVKR